MIKEKLHQLLSSLPFNTTLIAVSKTKPKEVVLEAYQCGQKHFGENKVQEMVEKQAVLPTDIHWHFIGHLQSNKVKYIAPFVYLIHSVDSLSLLVEINKQALKNNRVIDVLLQFHVAEEESKYGLSYTEAEALLNAEQYKAMQNIRVCGVMGMATFTNDLSVVRKEFKLLKEIFRSLKKFFFEDKTYFKEVSMGMSNDYKIALEEGSTMVRIGSSIFGER